jgi:hypothetical protein
MRRWNRPRCSLDVASRCVDSETLSPDDRSDRW